MRADAHGLASRKLRGCEMPYSAETATLAVGVWRVRLPAGPQGRAYGVSVRRTANTRSIRSAKASLSHRFTSNRGTRAVSNQAGIGVGSQAIDQR
jgi:hypothetical protein